jgi:hypothetical protein
MLQMNRSYYYIVAGLPDLAIDGGKRLPSVQEFIEDTSPLVHPDDAALFDLFRLPYDNANLLAILEKRDEQFDGRAKFTREELAAEIKSPDRVPQYMKIFLDARRDGRMPYPELSAQNMLAWLFYDEVCANAVPFVSRWFGFERNFRNVCAACNCRIAVSRGSADRAFSIQRALLGHGEVTEALLKSSAPDFSLSGSLPWVERCVALSRDNPLDFEKGLDLIRWDIVNGMTEFSYFGFNVILAFTVKLGLVGRWQELDEKTGREMFDRMVKELSKEHVA